MKLQDEKFSSLQQPLPVPSSTQRRKKLHPIANRLLTLTLLAATCGTFYFQLLPALRGERHRQIAQPSSYSQHSDPADEWEDNIWPIRPPTPWDISTDFPFPRKLEYDVAEGTWLRLDVHPKSGEIVFDMAGDIYCLPAAAYNGSSSPSDPTKAVPILLGVPHDSDPHFSPEGERIVFRSDAELGIENIWVREWVGCEEMDLRPASPRGELQVALSLKNDEEALLAGGTQETAERRRRRLVREGRLQAQRVTNETYRWVSDARFHPSGSKVIATKWFTTSRSLAAGEGWEYPIPDIGATVSVGSGQRLIGRTLPDGWGAAQYGDQQVGPEQFIWRGEDTIIYSMNVADTNGQFEYSKDLHKGIYAIYSRNVTTGETERLVSASPGGASRPEISRDGRTLAYVTRVRDKSVLVLKDLSSGTIHHAWYGLTYDLSTVFAPMGTYPSFAFTPSDDAVIIWAAGQIHVVHLAVNAYGERVAKRVPPTQVHFVAHVEKQLAETRRSKTNLIDLETSNAQRVYAFKEMRADETGKRVVFQAAGATYVQQIGLLASTARRVPVRHVDQPYYSPSFVPGTDGDLVLHARWSDTNFTTFELANNTAGTAYELDGLPLGRYYAPVLCSCTGRQRMIAFVRTGGDLLTGNIVATAGTGLYIGSVTIPHDWSILSEAIKIHDVRFVPSDDLDVDDAPKMRFVDGNKRLLVEQARKAFIIDIAAGPSEFGRYEHTSIVSGRMSQEIVVTSGDAKSAPWVAFADFYQVYLARSDDIGENEDVWSKPGNATKGLARVSWDGGHDLVWSADGKKLFWLLGPYLHSLEVSTLDQCAKAIKEDPSTFGIACIKSLLEYQEVVVQHSSDINRLKKQALAKHQASQPDNQNVDSLVVINAKVLTMEIGGNHRLITDGVLVSKSGVIKSVGSARDVIVPDGSTIIDAQGGYLTPGFIDVHAHWGGMGALHPAKSWEQETFLAYGITTLHNPSSDNVDGFNERSRVESGQLIGPRIFHTGEIIYGAGAAGYHQDIHSMDEAVHALTRIKVEGGPASFSYKNYNLPSRASRQRLLLAARNLSMLCFPEGGMNYDWDLTYIIDGMTTIEHFLPMPVLYDDVLTLFALSGTGSTPTHIVNYGGAWGEQFVWATEDIPNDEKLRRFTRHDTLEELSESFSRPINSYALFNTSETVAKLVHKGLLAHIGAHGEPPLGLNYHAEMAFAREGGLSNYETLQAATSSAATTLGLYDSIGSLSPGKLADFLIFAPGVDLLQGDISGTRALRYVTRGGRMWEAESMTEVWPLAGRKQMMPTINAD
ncbi:hypothetical protein HWV62_45013 [Athelia sp. TMB]|nr:hypothetical protein HWV62_45013 [Athelia sp. TMB]